MCQIIIRTAYLCGHDSRSELISACSAHTLTSPSPDPNQRKCSPEIIDCKPDPDTAYCRNCAEQEIGELRKVYADLERAAVDEAGNFGWDLREELDCVRGLLRKELWCEIKGWKEACGVPRGHKRGLDKVEEEHAEEEGEGEDDAVEEDAEEDDAEKSLKS